MFWRRKRTESDFKAEISAHLELEIERLRSGISTWAPTRRALKIEPTVALRHE